MRVAPEVGHGKEFSVEARFALRLEQTGGQPQQLSGRLNWQHGPEGERLLLANPLGQGMAELESGRQGARLRLANGETRVAADASRLLAEVLGYELPVSRMPDWLLGRPGAGGELLRDGLGRPVQLREAGWLIDYAYEDEQAAALPARLTLQRAGEIELRLRIEEWR